MLYWSFYSPVTRSVMARLASYSGRAVGSRRKLKLLYAMSLMHLKALLAVITAAFGAVAGGTMINSMNNGNARTTASFLVTTDPSTLSISQGHSANTTVIVTSINGYSGTVALSVYYVNGGSLSSSFTPVNVNVPSGGTAKSILTIVTASTVQVGNYTVAVIGTTQQQKKNAASILTVHVLSSRDFVITTQPSTVSNVPGTSNAVTVIVTSLNGYNGTINLQATVPFGYITVTGGQTPLSLQAGQVAMSSLTIKTSIDTPLGTYYITVTGITGGVSHSAIITLVVDPIIVESLAMVGYGFNSGTNMTLTVQNTGTTSVTLQSYSVRDASGDIWSFSWINGPVIAPGSTVSVYIIIGLGCNGCAYTGIIGLFTQFSLGQSYTVTLTTMANHQFSFVVNR